MNKFYNTFENQLKEKMAGHEMPYDPVHWNDLQLSMKPKGRSASAVLVALLATVTFVSGLTYISFVALNKPSSAKIASTKSIGTNTILLNDSNSSLIESGVETSISSNPGNPASQNTIGQNFISNVSPNKAANSAAYNEGNANLVSTEPKVSETNFETQPQKKQLAFAPSVSMACAGTSVEFQVTSLPDGVTGNYIWNFGDGKFKAERSPSNVYTKPGQYDVSLSITDDNGRITTTVLNKAIIIVPTPKADFTWHFDNIDPAQPHVKVVNLSENATNATWTTKDGQVVSEANPSFDLNTQGKQMLALQVSNQNGCSNGTVKHISINSDVQLGASNVLKTTKDTFMPEALKSNKHNFVMTIYDQSNNVVYETSNRNKGWDGSLPGGLNSTAGQSYKWKVILINDLTKEEKYFNGTLNIIP